MAVRWCFALEAEAHEEVEAENRAAGRAASAALDRANAQAARAALAEIEHGAVTWEPVQLRRFLRWVVEGAYSEIDRGPDWWTVVEGAARLLRRLGEPVIEDAR